MGESGYNPDIRGVPKNPTFPKAEAIVNILYFASVNFFFNIK